MRDKPRGPDILIAVIISVFLNIFSFGPAFAQNVKNVKPKPAVPAAVKTETVVNRPASTVETAVGKAAAPETIGAELKKEAEKKKKKNLKRNIYIFDTIVSGLMHLLIGTGLFMIVLMILKWFFLERRVEK